MSLISFRGKKIYYFMSAASLILIGWAIRHFGETNLPPLIPTVRYFILALYANWFFSYILFVADPEIRSEKLSGWIWLAVIGCFLSLMHPVFSGDLMEYLIRGRMLGVYHVSPYQYIPEDFPNDMLRAYSVWTKNPDSYGPLSVYLQTLPVLVFRSSLTGMIWGYKLMILGFFWLAVAFFWKIAHRLRLSNATQLWAMFAYCPLIVVAAFIDGHNDVIMMAFSVVSLYYLIQKKYTSSFFFWTCGFLVKYMIALQLPFMILYALKERIAAKKGNLAFFVIGQLALNILLTAALFLPVWGGEKTFLAILRQKGAFYTNTVPYLFYHLFSLAGLTLAQEIWKTFFIGLFCGSYLYLMYRTWSRVDEIATEFFRIVSLCYLIFYVSLPSPIGYWYLLWAVFWIILAQWPKNLTLVVLYSLVGVLAFYKRPNYLAAIAAGIYAGSWVFFGLGKKLMPKRFCS